MLRWSAFVFFFAVLVGFGHAQDDKKTEKAVTAPQVAHIRLAGSLDEAPVAADSLFGSTQENFKTKIDRILKAKNDKNVGALLIHLDGLSIGFAKMEELRRAIADFKRSGKKVFTYMESGDAKDYLVACEGDRVCMPAPGWLMLVGTRTEILFYKDLLAMLGIQADFLQMGIFKFAAEPFIRNNMSKEARAQYNLVLDDFYKTCYLGSISRSRKGRKEMTVDDVAKIIDQGPFTAKKAKDLGLIDDVAYFDEFQHIIEKSLGVKAINLVKDYGSDKAKELDLSNPFSLFKLLSGSKTTSVGNRKDRIALIYAVGPIISGKSGASLLGAESVGSTTMIEAIREADKDPKVRAIILRIDSPGGSALASDLIWKELKNCKKPIIASMSDVAASGGYYIAMGAKKVYAQPGTLTGSIGVVGGKLALGGLYDKVGLKTETLSRGKNAGILSTTHPFTDSERKAMHALMEEVYDQFLDKVQENRAAAGKKFTRKQLIDLAEGRIWTGTQALDRGLVDALGSLEDAIADAKVMGGLTKETEVDFLVLPKARSFLDSLMEGGSPLGSLSSRELSLLSKLPDLGEHARTVEALLQLRNDPVWVMLPHGVRIR